MANARSVIPGNEQALANVRRILESGDALAFVGAGASAPLYPLWDRLLKELADEALRRDRVKKSDHGRWLRKGESPQATAWSIKNALGDEIFGQLIYETFKPRCGADGNHFTPSQAILLSLPFKGFVTTNYDHGLVEARRFLRPDVANTSYATWMDGDAVLRWATDDIFKHETCPILFAHGCYDRSPTVVLTSDDYHRAYGSSAYRRLFEDLLIRGSLVFVGVGFSDQWIEFLSGGIVRQMSRGRAGVPRHTAILGVRSNEKNLDDRRRRFQADFNCGICYYNIKKDANGWDDHGDLLRLLESLETGPVVTSGGITSNGTRTPESPKSAWDGRAAATRTVATMAMVDKKGRAERPIEKWIHETTDDDRYVGRDDDVRRLNLWAADPSVRVVAITGLGGLGKTSLVGHWLKREGGLHRRDTRGLFFWSFYGNRSVGAFLDVLRAFAVDELGFSARTDGSQVDLAIDVMTSVPLFIILDGLEVLQEGPGTESYGSLVDLALRQYLVAACHQKNEGLVVLTSRFPFLDISQYSGRSLRTLPLERLLDEEGAALLANCGVEGVANARIEVCRKLEGHPLAIRVFAAAVATQADRDPTRLLEVLFDKTTMDEATPLQGKLSRLLSFYEKHMPAPRKALMRLISLFRSPVGRDTLQTLAGTLPKTMAIFAKMPDASWRSHLLDLRSEQLILIEHDETGEELFSCHPVLRDHFRASMLNIDKSTAPRVADLLTGQPANEMPKDLSEIEPILSAIELLQEVGDFKRADELFQGRLKNGDVFRFLPAPHEGLRCAFGFVADATRQARCSKQLGRPRLSYYLNSVGLHGALAGELKLAAMFYDQAERIKRADHQVMTAVSGLQNKTWTMVHLGQFAEAIEIAHEVVQYSESLMNVEARIRSYVHFAFVLGMRGDVNDAYGYFEAAEELQRRADRRHPKLKSLADIWFCDLLIRIGYRERATNRINDNLPFCAARGLTDDEARCNLLLGRIALIEGEDEEAQERFEHSEKAMRTGHMMTELPQVLCGLAALGIRRRAWEKAQSIIEESIELARLRGMRPHHADSLIVRARLTFERAGNEQQANSERHAMSLHVARDDAQAALEIAKSCGFAWAESDALHLLGAICHSMGDRRNGDKYKKLAGSMDKRLELDARVYRTRRPSRWRHDY